MIEKVSAPKRILVVEDTALVRNALCRLLLQAGYIVFPTVGFDDAVARINELSGEIDMVITDNDMEKRGAGVRLAALIKGDRPSLPVILMSADDVKDYAPANAFLKKSELTEGLLALVVRLHGG